MNGGRWTPSEPIVWATDAICSGEASTPPWPIPATPSERSESIASGFGVTLLGTG